MWKRSQMWKAVIFGGRKCLENSMGQINKEWITLANSKLALFPQRCLLSWCAAIKATNLATEPGAQIAIGYCCCNVTCWIHIYKCCWLCDKNGKKKKKGKKELAVLKAEVHKLEKKHLEKMKGNPDVTVKTVSVNDAAVVIAKEAQAHQSLYRRQSPLSIAKMRFSLVLYLI